MKSKQHVVVMFLVIFLSFSPVGSASFTSIYALGDSLSDLGSSQSSIFSIYKFLGGNCDDPGHPCPPYYQGRFSNGRVANEYLADAILPGGGNEANFSSFAVAGSTTGIGNYGDGGSATVYRLLPGMLFQIRAYLPSVNTEADALHIVWGGANDYLTGDSATDAALNIANIVGSLATNGAKNILVPNLPDLSLTPFVQLGDPAKINSARDFSQNFNQALASELGVLNQAKTTNIFQFDTFSLFNKIIQYPASYGFTNTVDACVVLTDVCTNQDQYVFWDDFHPTTQVHAIIASAMTSAVPIPSSIFLFAGGLLSLIFQGNAKRKRNFSA